MPVRRWFIVTTDSKPPAWADSTWDPRNRRRNRRRDSRPRARHHRQHVDRRDWTRCQRATRLSVTHPSRDGALNAGSLNYLKARSDGRWAWPPMLFDNLVDKIEKFLAAMREVGTVPECECFDTGIVRSIGLFKQVGLLTGPIHVSLVMGVASGMPCKPEWLPLIVAELPEGAHFQTIGIGQREVWLVHRRAAELGGHLRTGLKIRLSSRRQQDRFKRQADRSAGPDSPRSRSSDCHRCGGPRDLRRFADAARTTGRVSRLTKVHPARRMVVWTADAGHGRHLAESLRKDGYSVRAVTSQAAMESALSDGADLLVAELADCDLALVAFLAAARCPMLFVAIPQPQPDSVTELWRPSVAYDVLASPLRAVDVRLALHKAQAREASLGIARRVAFCQPAPNQSGVSLPGVIAESKVMQSLLAQVARVAVHPTSVLLLGESGTGKEVLAKQCISFRRDATSRLWR